MFARTGPAYKYNRRIINKKTRDFWGADECCRRSRDQMYCKCPTHLEGLHPIIDGEYIWYILDPDIGYKNDTYRNRLIDDVGNTLLDREPRGSGSHDGHMHSGVSLSLGSDGYIDIPVSSQLDTVVYFDGSNRIFKQVNDDSGLGYIRLGNGIYGPIVKLSNAKFTQYDLDNFTMNPINILRWKFKEDIGISIPSKYEHEVYACIEGDGDWLYEIYYNQDTTRYLTIYGSHLWRKNESFGVQTLRLKSIDISLPYQFIVNNGIDIFNNGEQVINYY